MPALPNAFYRVAHGVDAQAARMRRAAKRRLGLARPYRVLPYRGFGTAARVVVKARVVEDRGVLSRNLERGVLGGAIASVARFRTAEVPGVDVVVRWAGHEVTGTSDAEGHVDVDIVPPPGLKPGWHTVSLEIDGDGQGAAPVDAEVLLVGDDAEYGVISDIDDTVIHTDVRNIAKRAWALFMAEATLRRPFEDVGALYDALARGREGGPERINPLVYVSSSPWNLFDHLEHFLVEHDIPAGPILLRDWGLTRDGFAPGGGHGHKREKMKSVIEAFPGLPFVLIGDSGQEDAEHYLSLAEEYGDRMRAIYIRRVLQKRGRDGDLADLAERIEASGSVLVVFENSAELAADAAARGFIPVGRTSEVV